MHDSLKAYPFIVHAKITFPRCASYVLGTAPQIYVQMSFSTAFFYKVYLTSYL